ncbi:MULTISPECIES: ATP-dependent DNA helicase [Halolamina]|uniref:DNA excision repair protein ERCC-2 n=1 Tax=Halolamina pelagica TaxID=699431 RepID=A0A1I5MKI9_9EURY|nr:MULTISPECIES: ATP-dependent DNA helicase [Halolamina]NHX36068.1 ATP-dependent DNA helicase [Halolamina sp. R1-12]SFP10104.1 DNA excision repair protein ERCC-2 [Halolamina pelagica]
MPKLAAAQSSVVSWRDLFGHPEPYPEQRDGIEAAVEAAENDGFLALEGACGTGKTMLALSAGLDRVRDPESGFERVLVLTSVKQQLRQFEDDLRTINENLPAKHDPVSGLTLVGKADVCPYARENRGGVDDENVYDRCEGLRERTRNLVGDGGPTTADGLASGARSQQVGIADSGSSGADYLETAGEPTPYRPDTEEYGTGTGSTEYCPFYAQYLADLPEDGDPAEAVPFDFTDRGLIDTEELVSLAAGHGSCPHSIMGAVLGHMEVVIGNYYHAFDPTTSGQFTGALVDDSTFVVCDEAHMLEPRVRDLVSDGVGDRTLRDAVSELTRVVQAVEFDDEPTPSTGTDDADLVRGELQESDVKLDELRNVREFCESLREELDRRVKAHLDSERPGWRAELNELDGAELPLRDPETPGTDEITDWAERAGFGEAVWSRAEVVGAVVTRILNELEDEDASRAVTTVGRVLNAWYREDHESFFREIELERTWDETERPDSWRRAYNARLSLHNCVPSRAIGDRLAEFGGGVLMSATLEPLDVFREVTGLNHLEREGRPVTTRSYGLGFPEDNRESFAVDAPKFTYGNRGEPGEATECRRLHVDAAAAVARSPGNVLVGMPSYGEAEWMAERLEGRLDEPVLLDSSSTDEVTEELKAEFFRGEPKVLVTSIRGTLTEGVDYQGDRLAAAVVCGVPIINTASPRTRAVRTAYDREFGDGFETALTVPAVRKARQAIGRVIRGPEEVGIRALVDARYARKSWNSVREYLPEPERAEFQPVSSDMLELGVDRFWDQHR